MFHLTDGKYKVSPMPNLIKYIETANLLRNDIYSGRFPRGEFLPPETELCESYQVGRSTLRKSLAILSKEGFIVSKQGVGTMVASEIPQKAVSATHRQTRSVDSVYMTEEPHVFSSSPMFVDTIYANEDIASRMGLSPGSKLYRVQRMRYVNGKVYCFIESYINPALAPDMDKLELDLHITENLVKHYGLKRTDTKEWFEAVDTDFKTAQFLGIEVGKAVLSDVRVGYVGDVIFDYTQRFYSPKLYQLKIQHQIDPALDEVAPGTPDEAHV